MLSRGDDTEIRLLKQSRLKSKDPAEFIERTSMTWTRNLLITTFPFDQKRERRHSKCDHLGLNEHSHMNGQHQRSYLRLYLPARSKVRVWNAYKEHIYTFLKGAQ
jgi:hypothetical protein